MVLQRPEWLLVALTLVPLFILLRRQGHLRFSSQKMLKRSRLGLVFRLLPDALFSAGFVALLYALANPMVPDEPGRNQVLGRDIILALDISLSMGEEFKGTLPELQKTIPDLDAKLPPSKQRKARPRRDSDDAGETPQVASGLRRIDAAQRAILNFVRYRYVSQMGDRVGLVVFDQRPRISYPLSHDLRMVYRQLQLMDRSLGSGTNFGGYPPGPLDLAAELFDELGQATQRVVILITDGEDELGGHTMKRLADLLQSKGIRLYLVGVGETLAKKDVDIIKVAEASGGRVFRVENSKSMEDCFATIDRLERSAVAYESVAHERTIFYEYAMWAFYLFCAALVVEFFIITQ